MSLRPVIEWINHPRVADEDICVVMPHFDEKIMHRANLAIKRVIVSNVAWSKTLLVVRKFYNYPVEWQRVDISVVCDHTGDAPRIAEYLPVDDLLV